MDDSTTPNGDRTAWNEFWAHNSGREAGGCLPQRWAEIELVQQAVWHDFIAELPEKAELLDLATGDGRVLRWMREKRPDLVLEGIDLASELPSPPEGVRTHPGVEMEDLPFKNNRFSAVVSQFGFEYGDILSVTREIARILAPRGKVGLMVHRGDGPILEHNLAR